MTAASRSALLWKEGRKMHLQHNTIELKTAAREALYDITEPVRKAVDKSGVKNGLVSVYALGATAAIMIQEGWDESVKNDVITLLQKVIPRGIWEHDRVDGNADAHLKAGLVGPGETIPLIDGKLGPPPGRISSSANSTARGATALSSLPSPAAERERATGSLPS